MLGALAIAGLTLSPMPETTSSISPFCLFCGARGAIDALLNLLLFVPFGFGLRTAGVPRRWVIAASLAATVGIEILQVVVVPGRDSSLGDIIWNTTGGAVGALLADWWRRLLAPSPDEARHLARVAAAGAFLALALGAALLRPSYPEGRWFAQWRPPDAQRVPPRARVLAAEWNGVAIPNGPLANDDALRALSRARGLDVVTTVEPLETNRYLIGVLAAADHRTRPLWRIAASDRALRFWARMRGNDARFRTPGFLVPRIADDGAPGAAPSLDWRAGDTLRLRASRTASTLRLEIASRDARPLRFEHEIAPTHAAMLVLPMDYVPGRASDPLNLAALVVLFAPLGYWTGFAATRRRAWLEAVALPVATVVASYWVLARLSSLAVPPTPDWIAAFASVTAFAAAGAGVHALVARRPARAERAARR